MALACAAAAGARRLLPSAVARVLPAASTLALPDPSAPWHPSRAALVRAASTDASPEAAEAEYPRFKSLEDMAAWDLPAEGALAAAKAAPQELKQVYPDRPMTNHERSLFLEDGGGEELPQLKDHGFRFHTPVEALEGRPETVKRALSTFTASIAELRTFRKSELVRKFRTHAYDTGSARVQVAIMTERVEALQKHLEANGHDKASKRQLQMLVHRRRKMMQYLMRSDFAGYRILLREMGLRAVALSGPRHPASNRVRESHKAIRAKHSRQKRRSGRGHKGH